MIQQIVAGSNRLVNEASPIADARLADGSRVNVVLPPVALNGPIVTIRKFAKEAITMKTDGMAVNQFRSIGFSGFISSRRIQYIHQWWNRIRENHFLECTIAIYTQK